MENLLDKVKKIVIKIGTAGITTNSKINFRILANLAKNCQELRMRDKYVTIVTSGAIASGRRKLQIYGEGNLVEKQMYAAVGQPLLMQEYIRQFSKYYGTNLAQFLVTKSDFIQKRKFKVLYDSYYHTLKAGIIPVFNENDNVATREIRFSDNDELQSLIASKLEQDLMINLILHEGLLNKFGEVVKIATSYDARDYANLKDEVREGRGGLPRKLDAIKTANEKGKICIVGNVKANLIDLIEGNAIHTRFLPRA